MKKELKFISLILIGNLVFGIGIYFKLKPTYEITPKPLPLYANAEQIYTDYARGYTTLINCNYFRKTYPRYRKVLIKHNEVFFAYSTDPIMKDNYAVTITEENTIYLSDNFFAVKDAAYREGIIGHELMHIIGMPNHKNDNMSRADIIKDAIYITEHWCYHGDHPWTGND